MPRSRPDISLPLSLAETRRKNTLRLLKAAEGAEAWTAITGLVLQLRKADEEVAKAKAADLAARESTTTLTPEAAASRLEEMAAQAPLLVQARIFRRLLESHPDWIEEGAWE
jgi:hypothetical protein